jgi:hypothetical protein
VSPKTGDIEPAGPPPSGRRKIQVTKKVNAVDFNTLALPPLEVGQPHRRKRKVGGYKA